MRYELSDGTTGSTNSFKEEFKKRLKKGISVIKWKCEDANCVTKVVEEEP